VTDTNVIKLAQPGSFSDSLTEILRNGARALLAHAVETEVADFLGRYADLKTTAGHQRVVRHGHLPEREIMTGIGPVAVRQPRVRDREAGGAERAHRCGDLAIGRGHRPEEPPGGEVGIGVLDGDRVGAGDLQ